MSEADIVKWDGKYRDSEACRLIEPDVELLSYQSILPKTGRALDIACGLGKNSLYLAHQGLLVTALDGSVIGLARLAESARALSLESRVECLQADLDEYVFPLETYDLILVVRYLDRQLFGRMVQALKPGGLLIYKTFSRNILNQRPGFNPAFTIETEVLIREFSTLHHMADNAGETDSEYAFFIGRKPL